MKLTSEELKLLPLLAKVLLEKKTRVEDRLLTEFQVLEESLAKRPLDIRLQSVEPARFMKKAAVKKSTPKRTKPLRAVCASIESPKRIVPPKPALRFSYTRLLGDENRGIDFKKIGLEPLLEALYEALLQLPPREADILRKRYYFSDTDGWTLEALGDKYGISRQRVQQIERNALKKLRKALIDKFSEK
jgi:hypothetical protein